MDATHRRREWKQRRLRGFDYADPDHAYLVTIRALPGTAPFTDQRLARVVIECLEWLRANRGISIYGYCLMPDHLHLLLRLPPESRPLGDLIGSFKRFTTRQSWALGYHGAIWQARFHDRILRKNERASDAITYILANPSRAGLVGEGQDYQYSGCPDPL